jgi:hypothetical protein
MKVAANKVDSLIIKKSVNGSKALIIFFLKKYKEMPEKINDKVPTLKKIALLVIIC